MGVFLRADLTGHGHPSPSTTLLAPHIKKLETYFALLYFWTFAQCVSSAFLVKDRS